MADINGNKTGGRKKGTPNKVESTTKKFLQDLIDGNTDKITTELNSLKGKAFLDAVFNFMEYVQPKLSRSEVELDIIEDEIDLSKLPQDVLDKLLDSEINQDQT